MSQVVVALPPRGEGEGGPRQEGEGGDGEGQSLEVPWQEQQVTLGEVVGEVEAA